LILIDSLSKIVQVTIKMEVRTRTLEDCPRSSEVVLTLPKIVEGEQRLTIITLPFATNSNAFTRSHPKNSEEFQKLSEDH